MSKSLDQKLFELEQKIKLLEKQKAELEKKLDFTNKEVILFDIAEQEFKIPIRKKYLPKQSSDSDIRTERIFEQHL